MKAQNQAWLIACSIAIALATSSAMAEQTTAAVAAPAQAGTSTATNVAEPWAMKTLKDFNLLYIGKFDGPALSHFDSRIPNDIYGQVGTPSGSGNDIGNRLLMENAVQLNYKLNDKGLMLGATWNSYSTLTRGTNLIQGDSYVRIRDKKLFTRGSFNIDQDLRVGLPTSTLGHNNGEVGYLRTVQIITYDIPNTKWTVGSFNALRVYKYNSGADIQLAKNGVTDNLQDADFFALPNASYQWLPNLALTVGYEFDGYHNYGNKPLNLTDSAFGAGTSAGSLGVSWDITKNINFNPYLNIPLGGAVIQGTSLSAYLSATIL